MIRLNNKGQSLVLFVLLLPIMLLCLVLVIDIGNIMCEKQDLEQVNYMVVNYGIHHHDDVDIQNQLVELINLNCTDLKYIDVNVNDNEVNVSLSKYENILFGKILNISLYEVNSSYVGYISDYKIEKKR